MGPWKFLHRASNGWPYFVWRDASFCIWHSIKHPHWVFYCLRCQKLTVACAGQWRAKWSIFAQAHWATVFIFLLATPFWWCAPTPLKENSCCWLSQWFLNAVDANIPLSEWYFITLIFSCFAIDSKRCALLIVSFAVVEYWQKIYIFHWRDQQRDFHMCICVFLIQMYVVNVRAPRIYNDWRICNCQVVHVHAWETYSH